MTSDATKLRIKEKIHRKEEQFTNLINWKMLCYCSWISVSPNEVSSVDSSWDIALSQTVIFSDLCPILLSLLNLLTNVSIGACEPPNMASAWRQYVPLDKIQFGIMTGGKKQTNIPEDDVNETVVKITRSNVLPKTLQLSTSINLCSLLNTNPLNF